jgi:biotin carboxylase
VDRKYAVPDPEDDWFYGRVGPDNTPREEAFVAAIERICDKERIDTIFPTSDPWVYVFSKNKSRFEAMGITIPIPDFDVVKRPLDKYDTVQAAIEAGFPHPETHIATDDHAVRRAARSLPAPWVVKLRFTNGGRGMSYVWDADELIDVTRRLREKHGAPIVQEFIPGVEGLSFYTVIDKSGRLISCLTPKNARSQPSRPSNSGRNAFITAPRHPFGDKAAALARHIGWWGSLTIQTKIDERDGIPKIMEINPRLGVHLWLRTEIGVNEPLLCLRIARGEQVEPVTNAPEGWCLLKPIEDSIAFGFDVIDHGFDKVRNLLPGERTAAGGRQETLSEIWEAYRSPYRWSGERRYSPYYQYFREDPLPALIWSSKLLASSAALSLDRIFRPSKVKRPA